jgi:hypothetical protein
MSSPVTLGVPDRRQAIADRILDRGSREEKRSSTMNGIEEEMAAGASPALRATLRSTGLHLAALHLLGRADYTNEQYVAAVTLAEEVGIDKAYEHRVVGAVEATGEVGQDLHTRATRVLLARGITDPSYEQYRDALLGASA